MERSTRQFVGQSYRKRGGRTVTSSRTRNPPLPGMTKTRREEAIFHNYRKMMRKEGGGPVGTKTSSDSAQFVKRVKTQKIHTEADGDSNTGTNARNFPAPPASTARISETKPADGRTHDDISMNMFREAIKQNIYSKQKSATDNKFYNTTWRKNYDGKTKNVSAGVEEDEDDKRTDHQQIQKKNFKQKKISGFQRAKQEMEMKKEATRRKLFERQEAEEKRSLALKERKLKRFHRNKFLNQKNAKGQPVFKGQIQLILEKLQKPKI